MMKRQTSWTVLFLLVFMSSLAACDRQGDPTYDEASRDLEMLIDDALVAGLNGRSAPPKAIVKQEICVDQELAPTGQVQPSYRYHFPIDSLGPEPDGASFVQAVEEEWRINGMSAERSSSPGMVESFGSGRGFTLHAFVNFNTNMVLVAGNGPCVKKPS